jgi:F0F1-type ATP synthase assembly protein I
MSKGAAKTTTSKIAASKARRLFYSGLFDLSWRLTFGLLIPVLIGSIIDRKTGKEPLFTLIGLLAGFITAALIIRSLVIKLSKKVDNV